jgi:hypothetical protein
MSEQDYSMEPLGDNGWRRDLDRYGGVVITNSTDNDGVSFVFCRMNNGLQWIYSKNSISLSIILHSGSYGREQGKFETRCSWLPDVQGFLTFGQVQRKINTFYKKVNGK